MTRYFLLLLGIVISFLACQDESTIIEPDIDYGYEYFPLEIGKELIYRVDSIIYDPITETQVVVDTTTVYIRELVVDTFYDELDRLAYRVERYERPTVNVPWELKDVWSAMRTQGQAERFEENLRFIKMVFPVDVGDLWDGNAYIDDAATFPVAGESMEIFKGWAYEVITADELEQVGDFAFENVTTILQADEENLIEKRYSIEKYAEGVGLVYREMEILDTQSIDESIPWEEKADKGFQLIMKIVDYN